MLPVQPLDAALADAVALDKPTLRDAAAEVGHELPQLSPTEPITDSPLTLTAARPSERSYVVRRLLAAHRGAD